MTVPAPKPVEKAEVAKLREALLLYGTHDIPCDYQSEHGHARCTCGWSEARDRTLDEPASDKEPDHG